MKLKKMYDRLITDMRRTALDENLRLQIQYRYVLKILVLLVGVSSIINLLTERYTMGILLLILGLIYYCLYWVVYKHRERGVRIVTVLMNIATLNICIQLFLHGTTGGVAAIWVLIFPLLAFMLTGVNAGLLSSALLFVIVAFFCWIPVGQEMLGHEYSAIFLQRFPLILLVMVAISYFYENMRHTASEELRNQKQQMEAVYQNQYFTLRGRVSEAKKIRHDMRHHFMLLDQFLKDGKIEEAREYINRYYQEIPFEESLTYCEHYATNALLTYYVQSGINKGIHSTVKMNVPSDLQIRTDTLTVILGNLIENAVQACVAGMEADPQFQPEVKVLGEYDGNAFKITIDNTTHQKAKTNEKQQYLSSKHEGVGIGIRSVQAMVQQYNGYFSVEQPEGRFIARVVLYVNDHP